MSAHFGLRPQDIDEMTVGEIEVYVKACKGLPPPGYIFAVSPPDKK